MQANSAIGPITKHLLVIEGEEEVGEGEEAIAVAVAAVIAVVEVAGVAGVEDVGAIVSLRLAHLHMKKPNTSRCQ
jgi:hypothetical protein